MLYNFFHNKPNLIVYNNRFANANIKKYEFGSFICVCARKDINIF